MTDRTPSGPAPDRNSGAAQRAYARSLRLLGELIDGPPPVEELLDHLLAVAMTAAPGLAAASVTAVEEDGSLRTAASTDEAARVVDQHEYEAEEGPCFAAITTGQEMLIEDVTSDPRWPGFNARAAACGFACAGGLPLRADGVTLGALNLFGTSPGDLGDATLATLRRLLPPLAAALHRARITRRYRRLAAGDGRPE